MEDKKIDLPSGPNKACDAPTPQPTVSEELSIAIENLIQRLRENKPL